MIFSSTHAEPEIKSDDWRKPPSNPDAPHTAGIRADFHSDVVPWHPLTGSFSSSMIHTCQGLCIVGTTLTKRTRLQYVRHVLDGTSMALCKSLTSSCRPPSRYFSVLWCISSCRCIRVCSSEIWEIRESVRGLLLGPELPKDINKSLCDSLLFDIAEHAESSKYAPRVGTKAMAAHRLYAGHSSVPRDGCESRQEGFSESHSSDNMTKRFL